MTLSSLIGRIAEEIYKGFSSREAYSLLKEITRYHRIQGTRGIEDAIRVLAEWLGENGLSIEKGVLEHGGRAAFKQIASWRLGYGVLQGEEGLIHSTDDSPLLVAPHSPGGSIRGRMDFVEKDQLFKARGIRGNILLTNNGWGYEALQAATRLGAEGVIVYSEEKPAQAFPYTGLFLSPDELGEAVPVLTVPRLTGENLRRKAAATGRVEIEVDAGHGGIAVYPYLSVRIGNGDLEVHLVSHICHPEPGANDNGSGTVALAVLAKTISQLIDRGILDEPQYSLRFLWIPEYSGTMLYNSNRYDGIAAAVNLDMVGGNEALNGGSLLVIEGPPYYRSHLDLIARMASHRIVYRAATFGGNSGVPVRRFTHTSYDAGSDHDVYLAHGVPAIMINQWPDKYYHSSMDDIDKIDPETIRIAASIGGATAYVAASLSRSDAEKIAVHITRMIRADAWGFGASGPPVHDAAVHRLGLYWALTRLGEIYGTHMATKGLKPPKAFRPGEAGPMLTVDPPITRGYLYWKLRRRRTYTEISKFFKENKWAYSALAVHVPLMTRLGYSYHQIYRILRILYRAGMKQYKYLLGLLEEAGLLVPL